MSSEHMEYLLSKKMFCFVLLPSKLIISSGSVCVYIDIFNFLHCSILIVKCCFSKKFWDLFCLFFFIFSGNLSYDTSSSGCQTANAVKFTVNGKTLRWNSYLKAEKERRKTTVAMAPNNSHTHSLLMGCTSSIRTW